MGRISKHKERQKARVALCRQKITRKKKLSPSTSFHATTSHALCVITTIPTIIRRNGSGFFSYKLPAIPSTSFASDEEISLSEYPSTSTVGETTPTTSRRSERSADFSPPGRAGCSRKKKKNESRNSKGAYKEEEPKKK